MKKAFEECLYKQMKSNEKLVAFFADSVFELYDEFERDYPAASSTSA